MSLKILELFGGIGACTEAIKRLKIPFVVADYVEIDKYAVKSYNAINNTNFEPQDVTTWDKDIEVDLIMHGSPCQDFSVAGNGMGGDEGSGTRSSLMYETIRIVEKLKPKYVVWENVKNVLSKKHIHNFNAYTERLEDLGYRSFCKVLNAKHYGIPQNRERAFTISIREDLFFPFKFPEPVELKLRLKDVLEDEVDEKFYLSEEQVRRIHTTNYVSGGERRIQKKEVADTLCARDWKDPKCVQVGQIYGTEKEPNPQAGRVYSAESISPTMDSCSGGNRMPKVAIPQATKKGFIECELGGVADLSYPKSKTRRGRVQEGGTISPTITAESNGLCKIGNTSPSGKSQCNDVYDPKGLYPSICAGTHGNANPSIIDDTYKNREPRAYSDVSPAIRAERSGFKVTEPIIGASRCRNPNNPSDRTPGSSTEQRLEVKTDGTSSTLTSVQKDNLVVEPGFVNKEVCKSIRVGGHGSTDRHSWDMVSDSELRIRKLTPKECWRLMGFYDEAFEKAEAVNSNTQLYKQAGNSIVVDVLERILKKLLLPGEVDYETDN